MASKDPKITPEEAHILETLRRHPALKERFAQILEIAVADPDNPRTADQIEEELIEAIRQLGNSTMQQWAQARAEQIEERAREETPGTYRSKKKS